MVTRKFRSLFERKYVSSASSGDAPLKRSLFKRNHSRHFSKRTKAVMAFALITVVLVSVFAFYPRGNQTAASPGPTDTPTAPDNSTQTAPTSPPFTGVVIPDIGKIITDAISPKKPGIIETAQTINSSVWRAVAANAWKYYQPGVGVDAKTGLPWSGQSSPYFTDWDLGVYIQAVIDAGKLNLISTEGSWGVNERLDKVLSWLETRELNNASYPYWFYQAYDGAVWHENSDKATSNIDIVDTGRLFVALNNLRNYNSSFASRVNDVVLYGQLYNRSNYAALAPSLKNEGGTSIYGYYYISGFASFWPTELSDVPTKILTNILSADNVTMDGGVQLYKSSITGDVLLCSVFDTYSKDSRILTLANQVYAAHEAYYNVTGKFRAFGEGPTISTDWQWEWVIMPDGRTWKALNGTGQETGVSPQIYTKVALGFLAIYDTNFTRSMCIYLEQKLQDPVNGYGYGVNEDGAPFDPVGSLTNGLILGAALYYIQHHP